MAKEYAKAFYKSATWERCKNSYIKSVGGLCERCLADGIVKAGVIVHHINYITPENISDPNITTDYGNLELLCAECHNNEHKRKKKRYSVDNFGHVVGEDFY